MAKTGGIISINSDIVEIFGMTGAIQGMTRTANTNIFKNDVLTFVHSEMAREFDRHASIVATTQPENFRHVYEWRMVGNPAAQLWAHELTGPMNNKLASWRWLPSRQPIMTPRERKRQEWDNMSNVPDEVIAKLSSRRYVFKWKAPMMEFGMQTVVAPKYAKSLFIPGYSPGTYMFRRAPVFKTAGGEMTFNQFTELWTSWWSTEANNIFDQSVQKLVERDLSESVISAMRTTRKSRPLTATIRTIASNQAARSMAAASATAHLQARSTKYRRARMYLLGRDEL